MGKRAWLVGLLVGLSTPAAAQSPARVSVDSVLSLDQFGGEGTSDRPNIISDVSATVRLTDRWHAYVRPWFRQWYGSEWDARIYQAALRYERPGPIMVRVDAGYIASPVGLGMFDTRANLNPTILPHFNYDAGAKFDSGAPALQTIAPTYPLGGMLTLSRDRWDARAAVVNSAPTRAFVINGANNPLATPVFEAGGGITPRTGLRVGASFAHGLYATTAETTGREIDRTLTQVGVEGEYAFGYTKLSGELVVDRLTTMAGTSTSSAWFVQGMQTLTPRWFVAGRREGTSAPPWGKLPRFDFDAFEATAGYRATPEITLRGSYYQRRPYGLLTWEHQAGASIVWAHRWW